ncbi:MAG: GNAT family N-acetyltransferase [Candidatus Njordarchaeia archaeon]
MDIYFKLVDEGNVESFAKLYHGFYSELRGKQGSSFQSFEESLAEAEQYVKRGDLIIVALVNGEAVGYSRVSERDQVYWIKELYVKPEYRGMGVGRRLVEETEKEISKHDDFAYIMVLPQDRGAFRFWVKMGYTLLNSIELAKDFEPTRRSMETRKIEIMGFPPENS